MMDTLSPYPSIQSNPSDISGGGEFNFNKNLVIILAVLLYALVCVLGLYYIVLCALCYSRWLSFETIEATATQLPMTRLNNFALLKIPLSIYRYNGNNQLNECPICLVEFTDGGKVRVLPSCNISFHAQCTDMRLSSHSCIINIIITPHWLLNYYLIKASYDNL
ncbi:RING-H2 finger protein ATL72 [Dendrobium catenatum]|uniref:RING-H2 finger protein ATL72 n=1 Tax=Dendrobium catenatum TaxID=906689 RepID=A0A2I0X616_9ASPA|nr:RING-H2 finger protein ATL72 [Dendrobium catenatum]